MAAVRGGRRPFLQRKKVKNRNGVRADEIKTYAQEESVQKRNKMCIHEVSSRALTNPAKNRKEARPSVMPIRAALVSTARDVTGLLPPWQPQPLD
jgi:hypothetical protein